MAVQDVANLRGAPESPRRLWEGGPRCCFCDSGECNPPDHFCSGSQQTCERPTSEGGCDSSATGGAKAIYCESPYDTPSPTPATAPAPPLFTVVSQNTGCSNFASLVELGRYPGMVSNVFCAQACSVTKGCTFWTYQDEPNNVCEAAQPKPTPLQPALGDDACILFGGQCKKEENACWDVVTLAPAPEPEPEPEPFPMLICNGASGLPLFCKADATCCGAPGRQICCGPTGKCAGNVFSPVCVAAGTCSGFPGVCDRFSGPLCGGYGAICCGQKGNQLICASGFKCGGSATTPLCVLP